MQNTTEQLDKLVEKRTAELQKRVEEAEMAVKANSEFLANISHELRTPLHAIGSLSQMSLKKLTVLIETFKNLEDPYVLQILVDTLNEAKQLMEKKLHPWLTLIEESQKRQLSTVNDLLDLVKMESGQMDFHFDQHDLQKVIKEASMELVALFQEKELSLQIAPSNVNTSAYFDAERMLQVVRNLLSNAIKFTPKGKAIYISFECTGKNKPLILIVHNEGSKIPEDELELVFDRFAQSSKTKSKTGSTGLGLPICKEIMTAHNGQILASNHPDNGVVFTVIFPYQQKDKLRMSSYV